MPEKKRQKRDKAKQKGVKMIWIFQRFQSTPSDDQESSAVETVAEAEDAIRARLYDLLLLYNDLEASAVKTVGEDEDARRDMLDGLLLLDEEDLSREDAEKRE